MTDPKMPHEYKMAGIPVSFPHKAYPSQIAMMSKIITSLQKGRNCLLESPTGSGKSLALLCGALAWQKREIDRVIEYNEAVRNGVMEPEEVPLDETELDQQSEEFEPGIDSGAGFFVPENPAAFQNDDDDDFQDNNRSSSTKSLPMMKPENTVNLENPKPVKIGTKKIYKKKVPKIYFGTRTHKQISQIIRELRKTEYKNVKMTILGSREHTCIEPTVSKMKNKNEGCKELNEEQFGCSFKSKVKDKLGEHGLLNQYRGKTDAWEIEDIVKVGKKVRACPYYAIRELKMKSQIIFCPYNYLVDPGIRKSMEISLKHNIVILDEAHNIEDSAREAAGWQGEQDQIREAMQDLEKMCNYNNAMEFGCDPQPYVELARLASKLSNWIDEAKKETKDPTCRIIDEYKQTSRIWTGTNAVAHFVNQGFGPDTLKEYTSALNKVEADIKMKADDEEGMRKQDKKLPMLHATTITILDGFLTALSNMYRKDQRFRDDFRVALVKKQRQNRDNIKQNTWLSKNSQSNFSIDYEYSINFWCLNPAVTFEDIKAEVRSIVLTSGTLSPMASFSSELDIEFPIQLEANHVIDKKQVWIGTLSHGPSGNELRATYGNTEKMEFLDNVGRLTLGICQTIAHGVLLFLPSYRLLNLLTERWQNTGLHEELCKKKVVVVEPKFSRDFEQSIRHFYDAIETTTKFPNANGVDGALFIAVCRGKVSEGLDFADNNARAVICLGIPFPAIKSPEVDLKMKYNDQRKQKNKNILTGNAWYEIQAFRALNQALGRCIRHRKDWGAILMVDARYGQVTRYVESLSKWVRNGVQHHKNSQQVFDQLKLFREDMNELDQEYQAEFERLKALEPPPETTSSSKRGRQAELSKGNKPLSEWVQPDTGTNGSTTFSVEWYLKDMQERVQNKTVDKLTVKDLKNFIKAIGRGSRGNWHKEDLVQEIYDMYAQRGVFPRPLGDSKNVKFEPNCSPNNTTTPLQNPPTYNSINLTATYTLSDASRFVMKFEPENGSSSSDSKENIAMKPEKSEKFSMETGNDTDNISPAASSHLPLSVQRGSISSQENSSNEKPAAKKFKFVPLRSTSSDDLNKSSATEATQNRGTAPNNFKEKIPTKRKGYVPPPKTNIFYDDSDDDFQ